MRGGPPFSLLQQDNVLLTATRLCYVTAAKLDMGHGGFSFLRGGEGRRAALGVFCERKRQSAEKVVSAIDVQRAPQLMAEFDGFSGVAPVAGQRGDGVGA